MKTIILTVLLSISCSTFAYGWFPSTMQVYINSNHAQGTAFNNTPYALIQCRGKVFGRTQRGQIGAAHFCINVPRGGYANAYLHAHGYDYFTQAWAQVQCRPINFYQSNLPCF